MYWKSDPMFVCRLEDKDLPALGGPSEKVRGVAGERTGSGWRRGESGVPVPDAKGRPLPAPVRRPRVRPFHLGPRRNSGSCRDPPRWGPTGAGRTATGRHGAPRGWASADRGLRALLSRRAPRRPTRTPALPPPPCRPPPRRGPWPRALAAPPASACAAAVAWRSWTSTC